MATARIQPRSSSRVARLGLFKKNTKLGAAVEGLESDSQDDARQKKKTSKKRDLAAKQALSASPLKPQESATKSSITADRF